MEKLHGTFKWSKAVNKPIIMKLKLAWQLSVKKTPHQISYETNKWFSCWDLVTDRWTIRRAFHIKCSFSLRKECAILEQILCHIILLYWFPGTNAIKIQDSQDHILFKASKFSHEGQHDGQHRNKACRLKS